MRAAEENNLINEFYFMNLKLIATNCKKILFDVNNQHLYNSVLIFQWHAPIRAILIRAPRFLAKKLKEIF